MIFHIEYTGFIIQSKSGDGHITHKRKVTFSNVRRLNIKLLRAVFHVTNNVEYA